MADRNSPYNAFNFTVAFGSGEIEGGFSEVSGLGTEITVAEYRNGSDKRNVVTKIAGMFKVSDVTLKRGIINSDAVFQMFKENGIFSKRSILRKNVKHSNQIPHFTENLSV